MNALGQPHAIAPLPPEQGLAVWAASLYEQTLCVPPDGYRTWMLGELCQWLQADAALWRRRHRRGPFHSVSMQGLDRSFSQSWERTADQNQALIQAYDRPGQAACLSAQDAPQTLVHRVLPRFGIRHALLIVHEDPHTDLLTELCLFRKGRAESFTDAEARTLAALAPVAIGAARHALLLARSKPSSPHSHCPTAVVDEGGRLYEAQSAFIDCVARAYPGWRGQRLPFDPPREPGLHRPSHGPLNIYCEFWADLVLLRVWEKDALDVLTDREKEIACKIAEGWSYKLVARHFDISPSTVSNHATSLYHKLAINNRAELVALLGGGATD